MSDRYSCSLNAVLSHSAKGKWVAKRKAYQRKRSKRVKDQIDRHQLKTVVQEAADISGLAQDVMAQLAQKFGRKRSETVTCPCGCGHEFEVELPYHDVTVNDLVALIKVRSHLKGDPEFVVKVEKEEIPADLKKLSTEELEDRLREVLRDAEAVVLE